METTDPFGTRISFNLEVILAVVGLGVLGNVS